MPKGKRSARKSRGKSVGPPHRTHSASRTSIRQSSFPRATSLRKQMEERMKKQFPSEHLMVPSLVGKK